MERDNIKQLLLLENSKRNVELIANTIGDDAKKFDLLFDILVKEPFPLNYRAAWVTTRVTDEFPWFLDPHIKTIVTFLKRKDLHDGILRCLIRQLSKVTVPEDVMGELFDMCFSWTEDPKYALAIRANAMSVLYEISNTHKELKPELIHLFEQTGNEEAPAMISRSRILIKKLQKEISE